VVGVSVRTTVTVSLCCHSFFADAALLAPVASQRMQKEAPIAQ